MTDNADLSILIVQLTEHLEQNLAKVLARSDAPRDRQRVELMRSLLELAVLLERARRSEFTEAVPLNGPTEFADLLEERLKPHELWLRKGGYTLDKDVRELDRLLKLVQLRQYLNLERLDVKRFWERMSQFIAEMTPDAQPPESVEDKLSQGGPG